MTAIIAVATAEFVLLAGDKRGTYLDGSGHRDDMYKLYRINDKVMMGTSGLHHITEECIEYLQKQKLERATVQGVALKVRQFLRRKMKVEEFTKIVILGGIGDGNKITISTMQHEDNFKLNHIIPAKGEYHTAISQGNYGFQNELDDAIEKIDQEQDLNVNNVSVAITKIIKHVSEYDVSVSKESDISYIIRRDLIKGED